MRIQNTEIGFTFCAVCPRCGFRDHSRTPARMSTQTPLTHCLIYGPQSRVSRGRAIVRTLWLANFLDGIQLRGRPHNYDELGGSRPAFGNACAPNVRVIGGKNIWHCICSYISLKRMRLMV